jgi:hypothetical protein
MFGAKLLPVRETNGATFAPVELGGMLVNISSPRTGDTMTGDGSAELHFGLEHLGLYSDDVAGDVARLRAQGLRVFETINGPDGTMTTAFVEGRDNVRIELMLTPRT